MAQAGEVLRALAAAHDGLDAGLVAVAAEGDGRPPPPGGGKGVFTGRLERALLDGEVDVAVHSMKDLPAPFADGLEVDCFLPREDPRDVLVSPAGCGLDGLPRGASVGTSSPRRRALLLNLRPDLRVVPLHGNVDTRLARLRDGEVDAAVLAAAGLNRLGHDGAGAAPLDPATVLPAACQGILGVQRRRGDRRTARLLGPLNDAATAAAAAAERAFLAGIAGSCGTPVAALASAAGGGLTLRAAVARPDGGEVLRDGRRGAWGEAATLGAGAAAELLERAGAGFFDD